MTVMFTDIQSFTRISESLNPQENFDFINGYLREIVPVIRKHNGFIDKYIGDSVMALFAGSPDAALLAALEFEKAVEEFNRYLVKQGREKIVIGSGIHTGRLILGTIGHDHRLETTVISDAVNIASRLEGLTRHYHTAIIASEQTILKLEHPENFYFRYLETVRVKGKSKAVAIYEIHSQLENKVKASYQIEFEEGLKLMREKNFEEARNIFAELALRHPEDGALHVLVIRCDEYLNTILPEEWDGVKVMLTKE
jgi:class 3 adenylate cyclase